MLNPATIFLHNDQIPSPQIDHHRNHHIELQLLPPSNTNSPSLPSSTLSPNYSHEAHATKLQLSIGPGGDRAPAHHEEPGLAAVRLKEEAREQLKLAMAEKALADEARQQAKRQIELAEQEFANARRIRNQAQVEINRAHALREHAVKQINSTWLQITCYACKQHFQAKPIMASDHENSLVASYMSSVVTEGEEENDDQNQQQKISST